MNRPMCVCVSLSLSLSLSLSFSIMPVCVSFLPWPEQVVAFSSENNVMECGEITCDRSGLARLLDFLSHSFEGGTDVTGALALYPIPYTLVYTLLPSP
jgi:hypothetical protein